MAQPVTELDDFLAQMDEKEELSDNEDCDSQLGDDACMDEMDKYPSAKECMKFITSMKKHCIHLHGEVPNCLVEMEDWVGKDQVNQTKITDYFKHQ